MELVKKLLPILLMILVLLALVLYDQEEEENSLPRPTDGSVEELYIQQKAPAGGPVGVFSLSSAVRGVEAVGITCGELSLGDQILVQLLFAVDLSAEA